VSVAVAGQTEAALKSIVFSSETLCALLAGIASITIRTLASFDKAHHLALSVLSTSFETG
jgi:hypothetical protein